MPLTAALYTIRISTMIPPIARHPWPIPPIPHEPGCGGGGLIGKGYLVGGYYRDCDEYNRAGNVWANKADMPAARTMAGVCTGSDDTLYTIGGYTSSPFEFYLNSVCICHAPGALGS